MIESRLILSYVFNFIGLATFILTFLLKGKKMGLILFLNFCGNVLIGLAYLLGGNGINGAISSFLGGAQAIIIYLFEKREKDLPKWLIVIFIVSFIGVNLWVGQISWFTLLAVAACMCSVLQLIQKSGKTYRIWAMGNCLIWSIYDICTQSYGGLIIHLTLMAFNVVGMIWHDRKKNKETA